MTDPDRQAITLSTLHEDLTALREDLTAGFGATQAGFADLKTTLVAGFRSLPSRESSEEMVRLLREGNRLQEARFTLLDARIREQHLETQQVLHALAEGQRSVVESLRLLTDEVRDLAGQVRNISNEVRNLSGDIKALIARLDALIKGRGNGSPAA